jgi:hypothetical protein
MSILAAVALSIGAGKALNNTDTNVPGWTYSAHVSAPISRRYALDAGYTRIGISMLGEDAAIGSAGVLYRHDRLSLGLSVITGASYSHAVWWNPATHSVCVIGQRDCTRYANDGSHYSRACHLCGGVIAAQYSLGKGFALRAEYYGLRRMNPTFQGTVIQITYTIGGK